MTRREKEKKKIENYTREQRIIAGLRNCLTLETCNRCPYANESACVNHLQWDALGYLESKRTRLLSAVEVVRMSTADAGTVSDRAPIYVEYWCETAQYPKWLTAERLDEYIRDDGIKYYNRMDILGWRCWTACPTQTEKNNEMWDE